MKGTTRGERADIAATAWRRGRDDEGWCLPLDPLAAALAATHVTTDVLAALEANVSATKDATTLADVSRHDRSPRVEPQSRLRL